MNDNQSIDQVYDETDSLLGPSEPQESGNQTTTEHDNTSTTTDTNHQANAPQAASKPLYTADEMRSLDWATIDTSRIPPEHNAFYTAMQASYTKKRQAETDELRKLATGTPTMPPKPIIGAEVYAEAVNMAQQFVMQNMPQVDTLDPKFSVAVNEIAGTIVEEKKRQYESVAGCHNLAHKSAAKYGSDFRAVDDFAEHILLNEYPTNVAKAVADAAASGNFVPFERILDEAHKRLKEQNSQKQHTGNTTAPTHAANTAPTHAAANTAPMHAAANTAPQKTPPVTIGAGSRSKPDKDDTFRLLGF